MKILFSFLISLFVVSEAHARFIQAWDYDTLNANATLIVVATPTSVTKTSEVTALPNIWTQHPDGRKEPVMGRGVETTFQILTVLKGERAEKTLVLHHYEDASGTLSGNGPRLVSFEPNDKKQYLLFLKKEADGRYVAVSGQTDPIDSIRLISERLPLISSVRIQY